MIANYHTHTWRCNHARGTEVEYVESALKGGMEILGFSDHTPYFFPGEYYSTYRMRPDLMEDYVQTVQALKRQYKDQIEIHLGVECEYFPLHFRQVLEMLVEQGVEYMILGQHFTNNEYDGAYCGSKTNQDQEIRDYVRQCMEAMNTGLYTYVAHPDVMRHAGDPKRYKEIMRHLCKEANSCGMPLEINLLGLRENKWYPQMPFLEACGEENCKMILGIDAHNPQCLNDPVTEGIARELVKTYGLKLVDRVELRPIHL